MILDLVVLGVAITLEPIPITAFILVLSTKKGVRKGAAYLLGWLVSLVVVIALVTFATGGKPLIPSSKPSTAGLVVKLLLGILLVLIGIRRQRHKGRPRKPPSWMKRLENLSGWTAFVLAMFVQPWVLVAAGAATITDADLSKFSTYLVLMGFVLLSTASILILELYATFRPEKANARLTALRAWMDRHRDQTIVVLSLAVGFWLVAHSSYQLVR